MARILAQNRTRSVILQENYALISHALNLQTVLTQESATLPRLHRFASTVLLTTLLLLPLLLTVKQDIGATKALAVAMQAL